MCLYKAKTIFFFFFIAYKFENYTTIMFICNLLIKYYYSVLIILTHILRKKYNMHKVMRYF